MSQNILSHSDAYLISWKRKISRKKNLFKVTNTNCNGHPGR